MSTPMAFLQIAPYKISDLALHRPQIIDLSLDQVLKIKKNIKFLVEAN